MTSHLIHVGDTLYTIMSEQDFIDVVRQYTGDELAEMAEDILSDAHSITDDEEYDYINRINNLEDEIESLTSELEELEDENAELRERLKEDDVC